MPSLPAFDSSCTDCPRLAKQLVLVRRQHPDYFAQPVPPFGARHPRLLIVGLAPGMHGANRTGRPFTGDHAGILLYETLHRLGFANQAVSVSAGDRLRLRHCRITNAVKCLPPQNKPTPEEIRTCNRYLAAELVGLKTGSVILALGRIAHESVLMALGLRRSAFPFAHAASHELPRAMRLIDSYHCSRYNTQTRRLTPAMFEKVLRQARRYVDGA